MEILKLLVTSGTIVALLKVIELLLDRFGRRGSRLVRLETGQRAILYDRVKYLCKCYLKDKHIDLDDRAALIEMHETYQKLGGNGNLDRLMDEIMRLPHD